MGPVHRSVDIEAFFCLFLVLYLFVYTTRRGSDDGILFVKQCGTILKDRRDLCHKRERERQKDLIP